jgi:hypothetical protein
VATAIRAIPFVRRANGGALKRHAGARQSVLSRFKTLSGKRVQPDIHLPSERGAKNMLRDTIKAATTEAMKARDSARLGALRLISAALKNKDIELRTGTAPADDDALVADVLMKMAKQRRESIEMYDKGGRAELADAERAELAVIESFLPKQMDEAEALAAIKGVVAEVGATSVKDMGRVMAAVKERFAGKLDMSKASGLVKAALS